MSGDGVYERMVEVCGVDHQAVLTALSLAWLPLCFKGKPASVSIFVETEEAAGRLDEIAVIAGEDMMKHEPGCRITVVRNGTGVAVRKEIQ